MDREGRDGSRADFCRVDSFDHPTDDEIDVELAERLGLDRLFRGKWENRLRDPTRDADLIGRRLTINYDTTRKSENPQTPSRG